MASDVLGRPRLLKGAIVVYEPEDSSRLARVITFQYNPEQLTRSLEARAAPREPSHVGGAREDVLRVLGPPVETISLTIELDAADQLEHPRENQATLEHGLHPALATLELLLYPTTARVEEMERLARQGEVQVAPPDLPLTVLVWGRSRAVPVLLTSFSVTEQAFDQALNPIRATVELGMRVLTDMELQETSPGYRAFRAYRRQKDALAREHRPHGGRRWIAGPPRS